MPITLPAPLPAFDVLRNEGVMVMSPERAQAQEIRGVDGNYSLGAGALAEALMPFLVQHCVVQGGLA